MATILIVDDDRDDLLRLKEVVSGYGHTVILRSEGFSALTVVRNGMPVDAVVTECWLTDMDGKDFLSYLKRYAPATPVIVLTGHSSVESYIQCVNNGAFEYVNKPVKRKMFRKIIESALDRKTGVLPEITKSNHPH